METNIYRTFFCGPSPLHALPPLISIIFLRPVLRCSLDTGLGEKLVKAKMYSRAARIMMPVRLAQGHDRLGNAIWDLGQCLSSPVPARVSPVRLETYLYMHEVEPEFMSSQISSCLTHLWLAPSPTFVSTATLIKQRECGKQNFIACFLSKVDLILEVTNSLTFYRWALVCGFWSFPRSTEQWCGLAF